MSTMQHSWQNDGLPVPCISAEAHHDAINTLQALAREVGAERLFIAVYAHLIVTPTAVPSGTIYKTYPVKIELLAYHLFPLIGQESGTAVTPHHVERAREALDTLYIAALPERGNPVIVHDGDETLADLLAHLHIDATYIRGSAYPGQTRREVIAIQGHFERWFAERVDIGPQRADMVLQAMMATIEARYQAILPTLKRAGQERAKRWVGARRGNYARLGEGDRRLLRESRSEEEAYHHGYSAALCAFAPEHLPVRRDELALETPLSPQEWRAFCALLGLTVATRGEMRSPVAVSQRPLFVFPDGRVLLGGMMNAVDQLWEAFDREARQAPEFSGGKYAKRKAKWLEAQVSDNLRRIFAATHLYRNLSYPNPDQPGETTELDVAIAWPPFLVLVEAKAKQFRLEGRLGDVGCLRSDVRANVADAFEQARRAARYIQANAKAEFTEIGTGRRLRVRRDEVLRTYLMTVSQHQLAGLATRLASVRSLNLFTDGEYPWALSIADLELLTEFCPGPDVFLHYAERRLAIQHARVNLLADELDLFGAYLDTRLQANRLWERDGAPFDVVSLSGFQTVFDAVMAFRDGDLDASPDVRLDVPPEVAQILNELRRWDGDAEARWVAFCLKLIRKPMIE